MGLLRPVLGTGDLRGEISGFKVTWSIVGQCGSLMVSIRLSCCKQELCILTPTWLISQVLYREHSFRRIKRLCSLAKKAVLCFSW